jgi:hypothetical protein
MSISTMSISPYHTNPFQNMAHDGGQITGSITAPYGSQTIWPSTLSTITDASLHVSGDAIVTGTLKVGGQNITKTIDERLTLIEERLAILRPDPDLESRWDELKQAREHYMKLEAEFKSYERVIDILKT